LNIKIAFISLGCDKNLVDSEIMIGLLTKAGYAIISDYSKADVIVVNTCCFIEDATQESIDNILEVSQYKLEGKCKALIVAGCMAQRYKEEIFKEIPEVDAIVGTTSYEQIVNTIDEVLKGHKIKLFNPIDNRINESIANNRIISTAGYYAYLKIAEGCNNHCTYCIIPKIRGKYRSRNIESLINEAKMLVNQGVKELIIVAQDITNYGLDLYGKNKLCKLLKELAQINDLEWIRLLYAYPEQITDELIDTIASESKICNYLDMPIQHSSDRILKKMARKTNQSQIKQTISKLRDKIPDISLRTTLITGFPGETEEDFNNMVEFVKDIEFDRLGVFTYSRQEDTPAYNYPNQIDENTKLERKNIIMNIQKNISAKKCNEDIGKIFKVLIDGKLADENVYCGRTYKDAPDVDGLVFIDTNKDFMSGDFVSVCVKEASDYDLIGLIVK